MDSLRNPLPLKPQGGQSGGAKILQNLNHPFRSPLPLVMPSVLNAPGLTETSQSFGTPLPEPPAQDSDAMAMPWMGFLALAVLAALSLGALRLRFSDAPAAGRTARRRGAGEEPIVVPRPSLLFRRSHHEKMHDQRYLSLILEAELESTRRSQARQEGNEEPPARG